MLTLKCFENSLSDASFTVQIARNHFLNADVPDCTFLNVAPGQVLAPFYISSKKQLLRRYKAPYARDEQQRRRHFWNAKLWYDDYVVL